MRSFIFCTSCICNQSQYHYFKRYKRWIDYYSPMLQSFQADRLFMIDDAGSNADPSVNIIEDELPEELPDGVTLYRFKNRLGRPSQVHFPGWWRSFLFSIEIAKRYGYKKIVHIESDFFVLSPKLKRFIRDLNTGWISMYSHFYQFPETGIQVICEDAFPAFDKLKNDLQNRQYASSKLAEFMIPFTSIRKNFIGDRIGEETIWAKWLNEQIPLLAKLDYIGQMNVSIEAEHQYEQFLREYKPGI